MATPKSHKKPKLPKNVRLEHIVELLDCPNSFRVGLKQSVCNSTKLGQMFDNSRNAMKIRCQCPCEVQPMPPPAYQYQGYESQVPASEQYQYEVERNSLSHPGWQCDQASCNSAVRLEDNQYAQAVGRHFAGTSGENQVQMRKPYERQHSRYQQENQSMRQEPIFQMGWQSDYAASNGVVRRQEYPYAQAIDTVDFAGTPVQGHVQMREPYESKYSHYQHENRQHLNPRTIAPQIYNEEMQAAEQDYAFQMGWRPDHTATNTVVRIEGNPYAPAAGTVDLAGTPVQNQVQMRKPHKSKRGQCQYEKRQHSKPRKVATQKCTVGNQDSMDSEKFESITYF